MYNYIHVYVCNLYLRQYTRTWVILIQREILSVTCDRYSTNKTDHHDITEIFLKVALSTTTPFPFKQIQYEK